MDPVTTKHSPCESSHEQTTSDLDGLLIEKLERALHKPTRSVVVHDMAKIASEHSAVDLAVNASHVPPPARAILFQNIAEIDGKIAFIINTNSSTRVAVLRETSDREIAELLSSMPPDEAVEVLEDLAERRHRRVIELLENSKATRIREIRKNARNTAGRLMTNEFFSFSMETTIGEAASKIRNQPGVELSSRIFILNDDGEIQGYVPERNLIINPSDLSLRQVMRPVHQKVYADAPREEVADLVERYKISALPVVDENDRLIGVINYEDVIDAMQDILDETIGSVAGTSEKVSENEPVFKKFIARAPWLLITLFAGLINVGVMSSFELFEKGMLTFVLFFVPLITGMSGNIGIQCSTVLIRSMALGLISRGHRKEAIYKELANGAIAGLFFGLLCGLLITLMDFVGFAGVSASPWAIGLIVAVGLFGACLTGTLLGVFSPFFFAKVGVDPAVAAGPIVTAFNDFLSMTIYFLIAIGLSIFVL